MTLPLPPAPDRVATAQALAAAVSFASMTTLASLAYAGGADPFSVVAMRCLGALGLGIALIMLLRPTMPRKLSDLAVILGLGVVLFLYSLLYMASVLFIPVGLATLLFYLWPIMVAVYTLATGQERLTRLDLSAFTIAFLGLTLAIGPGLDRLDWRGVALAIAAAAGLATFMLITGRVTKRTAGPAIITGCNLVGLILAIAAGLMVGRLGLPVDDVGRWAFLGLGALFGLGMLLQISAVTRAGAARVSIFFNLEPLIAIGFGAWLLGERLDPAQYIGAVLVVGALGLTAFRRVRAPSSPAPAP